MKGEYVEEENDINNNNTQNNAPNMFAKFSHHPKFHPPPPPPHHHHHHFPPPHLHHSHHPFSEESDSATTTTPTPPHQHQTLHESITKKPKIVTPQAQTTTTTTSNEDGGTIEVSRRPRGRPPGSKNKPKPPVVITREPDPAMSPYILELPSGADVIDSLTRFTRRRGVGLCVLAASGAVANVTLNQPSTTTPGGTVTFHGRFDILSLSAVVVNTVPFHGGAGVGGGGFTISLAGPQGQIVGGKVVGTLACSGTVYVIAASFNNPTYCRLPLDEQEAPNSQCHDEDNSAVSGGGDGGRTMSLYSGHLGNTPTTSAPAGDVIWATPTTARPTY
ncbi:AT-hook motif nuclear-localized protein 28-like [Chenopodium quinoa]|uniref:AT-hook motif nuclear-localized protein 28-like n=1 Tax=Chenopodium quinoa TaxID=63459 RepID=UPI000B799C8E|nr:AT-hook motif nuclear-localized protein 28-like [Chenopodium quinoa]